MLFPVNLLVFAIAAEVCIDNELWRDTFGWSCRDYTRVPSECRSKLAVSVGGIEVQEACCACVITVERRRDYESCLTTCVADQEACDADCLSDRFDCNYDCTEEYAPTEEPAPDGGVIFDVFGNGDENGAVEMEWWAIVLIVLGILLCLCTICVICYLICMTRDEGTCEDDDCATQQPMLVGGGCDAPCESPCDNPCDTPCDNPAPQMAYNQVSAYNQASAGYPQGQRW